MVFSLFLSSLLKSLQLRVKKSQILFSGLVSPPVATPKPHNVLAIPHLNYF